MKDEKPLIDGGPLAKLGAKVIDNGYAIVPIAVGKKSPGFDGWIKVRSTKGQLNDWIEHGHRNSGVGVLTKHTPAIDIDVLDKNIAEQMEQKVREIIGDAPLRIGMAPKRLLLFRTDKPFKKLRSTKYMEQGDFDEKLLHQIEILGDGQQFVAYHTHPDTNRPYVWPDENGPAVTPVHELPYLTEDQGREIIAHFEEIASKQKGWSIARKGITRDGTGEIDMDDPFLEDSSIVDITYEDLREKLLMVPNPEDYDTWLAVGMALYHQFDGDETGLDLWHEWSETANNYEKDQLDSRWSDFGIDGKKRAPSTARTIIKWANEAAEATKIALGVTLRDGFKNAKTMQEWDKARDACRASEIDVLTRSGLAQDAKDSLERIKGSKIPLIEVKKAIAYTPKKGDKTPGWVEPWVYDTSDDRFFCTARKMAVSQQGFNAMFDRKAMTKKDILDGKSSPSSTASDLALRVYQVEYVNGRRYEPGQDAIFHSPDGRFANTYAEHEIPEVPEKLLPRDKLAINRVKNHIRHLLEKPEERHILLDWISWVVQNPGKHVNWAILLQGTEGDGKSFFAQLLRAVMGVSNVRMLDAHSLEGSFTNWVVGQCVTCIEEVRLVKAANKYEVLNRMKPYITNPIIEVHPKGAAQYNARNTTSYLLFSNYRDALPIDDDGRRYCILFSRWQRKDRLEKFKDENPDYYVDLYRSIEDCAPGLRKWLLEREQSPKFNPMGDAPTTDARKIMVRHAKPEFIRNVEDLIDDAVSPLISEELIDYSTLSDELRSRGLEVPSPKSGSSMLERYRFDHLGRIKVEGEMRSVYSREPGIFHVMKDDMPQIDIVAIREFMRKHLKNGFEDDEEL